jgi:hypothetical protein
MPRATVSLFNLWKNHDIQIMSEGLLCHRNQGGKSIAFFYLSKNKNHTKRQTIANSN